MPTNHMACLRSDKQDWSTPPDFFEAIDKVARFTLDYAASAENALCPRIVVEEDDGTSLETVRKSGATGASIWCNPPYNRARDFCRAFASFRRARICSLLNASVGTGYWRDYVWPLAERVLFVQKRLKFGGAKHAAPFNSALVFYGEWHDELCQIKKNLKSAGYPTVEVRKIGE